jgi:hypothetical protein
LIFLKKREIFETTLISLSTIIFGNSRINIMLYGYLFDKSINRNKTYLFLLILIPNLWWWSNFYLNG